MPKQSASNHTTELKTVRISREAREVLSRDDIKKAITMYAACNWGDVGSAEWRGNDEAYKSDGTIKRRYRSAKGNPFLITTEAGKPGAVIKIPCRARLKGAC